MEMDYSLLVLRVRNLIAAREFNTAAANREMQCYGEWRCDHERLDQEIAKEIDSLMALAQVENTTAGADNEAARSIPDFDNRGLLPMIVSETGEDSEPEIERIICSSISGGSDYINEMPREVSLHRIFADGRTISARYIQITTDCALTPRSENV
jgi:hypothetical protein